MPNWCSTQIFIKCASAKSAQKFKNTIDELRDKSTNEDKDYIGGLLESAGITHEGYMHKRGFITYIENDDIFVTITSDDAWAPVLEPWVLLCDKYLFKYELQYYAVEPGMCLYMTNDPDYEDCYYVSTLEESYDCVPEKELQEYKDEGDENLQINKWEITPPITDEEN